MLNTRGFTGAMPNTRQETGVVSAEYATGNWSEEHDATSRATVVLGCGRDANNTIFLTVFATKLASASCNHAVMTQQILLIRHLID
jgi:hypothetical protein